MYIDYQAIFNNHICKINTTFKIRSLLDKKMSDLHKKVK